MAALIRRFKNRKKWKPGKILILFLSLAHLGFDDPSQHNISREYQIKAVFLFNFTQFTTWPDTMFSEPNAPLVIGVLGQDPFGDFLDQTIRNETVNGHPLIVQRFSEPSAIERCHILYLNPSDENPESVFEQLKTNHTLTVGDTENFARRGGMIEFYTEANKIRIRVNLQAVEDASISISSKLLQLAEIVPAQTN